MYDIRIGNRRIGEGHPTFVIAELGYNFSTLDEALRSVDAAADCGVDALKIQTFRADTIVTQDIAFPPEAGAVNQYEEFVQYEIDEDTHRRIFERAHERGIICLSTPSYFDDVELLERVGVELYKIGSDDLTNLPLIRYVAAKGKPVIFSSGMATLAEVDEAIRTFHSAGNTQLVLLQCVSNYPIEDISQVNLRVIDSYRSAFPVLVGFSDHTTTISAAVAAVALGAAMVEKHFTLDKKLEVPDAFFSFDPAEMKTLVTAIRETELMLGDGRKSPTTTEWDMRSDTRKSVIARRPIAQGGTIEAEDLIVKRPGHGIPPRDLEKVVGRTARRDIDIDDIITWEMV